MFNFVRRFGWVSAGLGLVMALVPMGSANAASTTHAVVADGHHHHHHSDQPSSTSPSTPATTPETPYAVLFPLAIAGSALWVYKRRRSSMPN